MTGVAPPHIVCLGDVMVDVVARLSGPLEPGSDRPAHIGVFGGGSAANTASWLDHLGASCTLLGRVGSDLLGTWSLARLGRELSRGGSIDLAAATGTCVVLVGSDGERTMVPDAGANANFAPGHLDAAHFAQGRHLHVSGYAIFSAARAVALHALSLARSAGMTISVGAASAAPLRQLGAETFLGLLGTDLLLFANRAEAEVLTGQEDPMIAATVLSGRLGQAIVTSGADGAVWCSADGPVDVGTKAVEDPETTGAGDAFAAGVLDRSTRGVDRATALAGGHAAAARACRTPGGRPPRGGH